MLIAQITDIHLGFDPGQPDELNRQRLDAVLAALAALDPLPDLLLATGDIADKGNDSVSYAAFKEAVAGLPFPVYPALGNHDDREDFIAAFPETPVAGGYVQYAIEGFPVRILVLDTLEHGRHGGGSIQSAPPGSRPGSPRRRASRSCSSCIIRRSRPASAG